MKISEKQARKYFFELRDFEWEDDKHNRCSVYVCAYDNFYEDMFDLKGGKKYWLETEDIFNCYIFANLKTPHKVELVVTKTDIDEYCIEKRYSLTGTGAIWLLKEIKKLGKEE